MRTQDARQRVRALLKNAAHIVPTSHLPDLPAMEGYPDVPKWHSFETELWDVGEQIRQVLNSATALRRDMDLYSEFFQIVSDLRGKRGRQSFVLLFGYKPCSQWSEKIAGLLPDRDIDGHIVSVLYKMKARGLSPQVQPYAECKKTWIRNEAKRYLNFDKNTEYSL